MLRLFVFLVVSSWVGMAAAIAEKITSTEWGFINGHEIKKFTLNNEACQEVDVITYGATLTAIRTPDKRGKIADVLLGFDNIEGYLSSNKYFGATIGRVANRIGKATFVINGQRYNVSKNLGEHSIHGGTHGWSFKVWDATINDDCVVMTLVSPDGDEGYPGSVMATVSFKLTNDKKLRIEMKAESDKATPINLTNHGYFNLAGHATNSPELYKHEIIINADHWTVTDAEKIPTGEIRKVDNKMDLRKLTPLNVIKTNETKGYDHNFCLPGICYEEKEEKEEKEKKEEKEEKKKKEKLSFVARVSHPPSGRRLEVYSNQPGVQFYTTNSMPENGIAGKERALYFKHAAFCLETQNYPDAVNHENFPNSVLQPGKTYTHIVEYKFDVQK